MRKIKDKKPIIIIRNKRENFLNIKLTKFKKKIKFIKRYEQMNSDKKL